MTARNRTVFSRRHLTLAMCAALALGMTPSWANPSTSGSAAAWPTQTVRLVVGFPAGSSPDLTARALAEPLSKALGQNVIVENKVGAGGNIAADFVAKSTDGHTLGLMINGNMTIARILNPKVPYDPLKDLAPNSLIGKARMGLQYALWRRGPLTMSPSQLGAFARSGPDAASADVEYHVQPLSLDRFGEPLHRFPAITASVCQLRPASRGWVRAKSANPSEAPEIRPHYLSDPEDRAVAANAIRLTRRIMEMPAMAQYRPEEFKPGPQAQTEEELIQAAGEIGTTIFHPVGTARMGPDGDRFAGVDHRMRVRGVRGLRVMDASVMPFITSGNTNSPTLMLAERGADMLLEDLRR